MMTTQTPRIGRPFAPTTEGERVTLGVRVSADTKRKLEDEALKTGRSLSQEAELRMLKTFDNEDRDKKSAEKDDALRERVEAVLEDQKDLMREVEEIKRRLLDLIELSKREDVTKK
jgi:hypothetical protein